MVYIDSISSYIIQSKKGRTCKPKMVWYNDNGRRHLDSTFKDMGTIHNRTRQVKRPSSE